jgi:polar amino acid transport system permease protein
MSLTVVLNALPFLLKGLWITLYVSLLGMLVGSVIGLAICIMCCSRFSVLSGIAQIYISFFRGVPLLVQLLLFYNLLPFAGIDLSPLTAAIAALALVGSAYIAEILRGSLNAVPRGHIEAAAALGFTPAMIWRSILLPQIIRLSAPAITNELILLVKASSLISIVGLAELTRVSQTFAASTFRPMELYLAAGAFYLCTNFVISACGSVLERRFARG